MKINKFKLTKYKFFVYILLIGFQFFTGFCKNENRFNNTLVEPDSVFEIKYAKHFTLSYYENYKKISIIKPYQDAQSVKIDYYLFDKHIQVPDNFKDKIVIKIPVDNIAVTSTTHVAFIDFINELKTIRGLSVSDYISNSEVLKMINNNQIKDIGYDDAMNIELIHSLKPDLLMGYNISNEISGVFQKLSEIGIKTVINAEYLEKTPLARAEWCVFVAAFFNKEVYAHEKFKNIEFQYNQLLNLTSDLQSKPSVIINIPYMGVWYVAGGKSYMANFIRDAGGDYIWSDNTDEDAFPSDLESIFIKAQNADIWLNTGIANRLSDIITTDNRLENFKPYKTKRIFNNNKLTNHNGGNDFFESGVVNPHIILKDLITILHPELNTNHNLIYYKCLE